MKIFSVILVLIVAGVVVAVVVLMGAVTRGTEIAAQEPPVVLGPDTVVVHAGLPGTLRLVDAPARSGPAARCGWYRLDVGEAAVLGVAAVRPSVGATYVLWCVHATSGATLAGYPTVAVYDPLAPLPGSAVSSYDAALYALAQIRFDAPVAELSPAADQVVGVPTWLAVVSRLDHPAVTAQAGPVWASVQAVPAEIEWDMGDGTVLTCAPRELSRWTGGDDVDPDCAHVYERRSENGPWSGRVTARWTILWRSDRDPTWRVFDTLALTSDLPVWVRDLESVIR